MYSRCLIVFLTALLAVSAKADLLEEANALRNEDYEQAEKLLSDLNWDQMQTSVDLTLPSATAGNAKAQIFLGKIFERFAYSLEPKYFDKAIDWYLKAFKQGVPEAALDIAIMYETNPLRKDLTETLRWYRLAAEKGNSKAEWTLASNLRFGQLFPKDLIEATKWYQRLAMQGDDGAELALYSIYSQGEGVSKDEAQAAKFLTSAAIQGNLQAEVQLGLCFASGQGVSKNFAEALSWFGRAAARQDADAQFFLGMMYRNGDGVTQNYAEADKWFLLAANNPKFYMYTKSTLAMRMIGSSYRDGKGVAKDYVKAHMWFNLAISRLVSTEDEPLKLAISKERDEIADKLTEAQLEDAQRLAAQWKPE